MKIIHATNSLTRRGGGTAHVVWGLAIEHHKSYGSVQVFGLADPYDDEDWPTMRPANLPVHTYQRNGPLVFGWSASLNEALLAAGDTDILHQHGIWSMLSLSSHRWKRRYGNRQIVAVHGMLDEIRLLQSKRKKQLFGALIEKANLREADCLHALCLPEARSMRHFGLKNPIAVIPNGVRLEDYATLVNPLRFTEQFPKAKDRRLLLYMGRLHPLKGLFPMLESWKKSKRFRDEGWMLVIAGPDQMGTEEKLKRLSKELGLENDVLFTGALYGEMKSAVLAAASVFVLPSKTEGFAMSLPEAMACCLPLVITRACNFPEVAEHGAGWEGEPTVESLSELLEQSLSLTDDQLRKMGERGYDLVRREYTWEVIASKIACVYSWLLGGGDYPAKLMLDSTAPEIK